MPEILSILVPLWIFCMISIFFLSTVASSDDFHLLLCPFFRRPSYECYQNNTTTGFVLEQGIPQIFVFSKIILAFIGVLLYLRNIPKVAKRLSEKLDKKRGTAGKSTAEMYLDVLLATTAQEETRRRSLPHNDAMFDNNGLTPYVQIVLMVVGGLITMASNSMLLLPALLLLDKLFKFKALRYFLCQTLGTNPIYSFTEEMLEVRYKVASEETTPASEPVVK